jgi:hypothetical protein
VERKEPYRRVTVLLTPDLESRLLAERAKMREVTGLPASKSAVAASLLRSALADKR